MRFKHAFHVLVDNFGATYKLLLYKLVVMLITFGLACAVIIPTVRSILSTAEYAELQQAFSGIWESFKSINTQTDESMLEGLKNIINGIQQMMDAIKHFTAFITGDAGLIALVSVSFVAIYLIFRFLTGIGNYVLGALVNDKMTLHANSSFTNTLIKNLGKASLYSVIYVPIAFLFDAVGFTLVWAIVFKALAFAPIGLLKIFLIAVMVIALYAVKFTFTCDWLPSLIHEKMSNRKAIAYTFSRKGKKTGNVYSTALVLILTIVALNVVATLFTFGAGLLLTLPASQLMITSYFFVNYFDNNKQKYFVDEYTIIGPKKEKPVSREEFFKGDE